MLVGSQLPVMAAARECFSRLPVYWNLGRKKSQPHAEWSYSIDQWIEEARGHGLDGLGLDARVRIDEMAAERCRRAGLGLFAWTVNEPEEAVRLKDLGVAFLATDRPGLLREALAAGF
jgi:glycerophosphoryl diester phosphodiesterase